VYRNTAIYFGNCLYGQADSEYMASKVDYLSSLYWQDRRLAATLTPLSRKINVPAKDGISNNGDPEKWGWLIGC